MAQTGARAAGGRRPLRVLQLITDRDRRGAQVFALDLAAGLRALGSTVETVALRPGTHGDLLPVRALGARRFGWRALRELRRTAPDYDVVIAHGSSTLPASALALVHVPVPIVYRQISDPTFWAASWGRRFRVAGFLRRMQAVVALSAANAGTLRRHYWLRERPAVTVIPNAVAEARFRPPTAEERVEARRTLGVPDDAGVILFVGALSSEKGADLAIAATVEVPAAVLLMVGDGPERLELEACASRRMPHRCLFVGSLDDPAVAYRSADLLLLPSRSEAMPAVPIEAGLCGLATVATDVGAVRDVVDHGITGLVVPPGDVDALAAAVAALMDDPGRRSAMGTAAAARCAERFTIARIAPAWFDVLDSLRPDPPRPRPG